MYTAKATIENYLQVTINSSLNDYIDDCIVAVDNWIDSYTGTTFESSETTKLYDGTGDKEILVDDFTGLTKIQVIDSAGNVAYTMDEASDYYLYPSNTTPKTKIQFNPNGASVSLFPIGYQNVKVYATFGHSASAPKDVELVATMLASNVLRDSQDSAISNFKSEKLGDYAVTLTDIDTVADRLGVKKMLDMYKKYYL